MKNYRCVPRIRNTLPNFQKKVFSFKVSGKLVKIFCSGAHLGG